MMRPSNSGTAIWVATSSGVRPSSLAAQSLRGLVSASPWMMGMSSAASCATSQASSSPPAWAVAGFVPPAARTVVMAASMVASSSRSSVGAWRSDAVKMGMACAPWASMASHRAWM